MEGHRDGRREPEIAHLKRPGRRPLFAPEELANRHEVHLTLSEDVWNAVVEYCRGLGEPNASLGLRMLIRNQLVQLGLLKKKVELFPTGEEKA